MKIILIALLFISISSANAQDFPGWFSNLKQWLDDDLISQEEFNRATEYLVEKGIVSQEKPRQASQGCSEDVTMNVSPIEIEKLQMITPMGKVQGSHVTPTDHQYWAIKGGISDHVINKSIRVDLHSPADGVITNIEKFRENDYRIIIQHSCSFATYYIHLADLSDKILTEAAFSDSNEHQYSRVNVSVSEDEIIGQVTGPSFDFSVEDKQVTLSGFISPERYDGEPWKIHAADPFDYFVEPIQSQLIEKTLRSVEPIGGKIDYDIEGKLVGNWFKLGDSYSGTGNYWEGHLSAVYDHMDPSQIRISLGDFNGQSKQFGVLGNEPDPALVSVQNGLVKYELVSFDYYVGSQYWDRQSPDDITSKNSQTVEGVVLMQVLDDSQLKVEIFPGKNASQVNEFTDAAEFYDR